MKVLRSTSFLAAAFLAFGWSASSIAADESKPAAPAKPKGPAGLKWRVQKLHLDNNEGCAIADFNHDGHLDISAGEPG